MRQQRLSTIAAMTAATALLLSLGASSVLAGEVTGNGMLLDMHANSSCAFSGQEDLQFFYDDEDTLPKAPEDIVRGDPGHAQSWGQIPKEIRDSLPADWQPGVACNPTLSTWPD